MLSYSYTLLADVSTMVGDPETGKSVYVKCMACHSLKRNRTGPRHCGLFGRRAGSVEGFEYSPAMRKSDWVWSAQTLDEFLASPFKAIPGTTMGFGGIWDEQQRADLIAYLQQANQSAECASSASF
jgi:cytochrome c